MIKDSVITGYRDHGHMLAYGIDPKVIMAELTGRAAGISKGKGGSMHMFCDRAQILRRPRHRRRAGVAGRRPRLRAQVQRGRRPVPCLFRRRRGQPGPGLRDLQHGRLWNLPIVFVVENNQYAMGTAVKRSSAETRFLPPRHGVPHSRHGGERHGRARSAPGRRSRVRACPRGQRPGAAGTATPTAIAATRCPTRRNTAPARKCRTSASTTTRSSGSRRTWSRRA